jgi:hypothetical protein
MPLTYMYRKRADIYTTQVGDKMQGLFITFDSRNKRHAQNKAYGTNRDKIVYQNQVGGYRYTITNEYTSLLYRLRL